MKHPLIREMPRGLDRKIRLRLLGEWFVLRKKIIGTSLVSLAVPAVALYVLIATPEQTPPIFDNAEIAMLVREAQAAELRKSETGIYHVRRIIREGEGKPEFVRAVFGETVPAEPRVDVVETWQHNDTALAIVESNGTERPFEAYLSREHDGVLGLYHYGPEASSVSSVRNLYDKAHDLASLYDSYRSLDRPDVPILPDAAELVAVERSQNVALFRYAAAENIDVVAYVNLTTYMVDEEIIYVRDEMGTKYEMTRVLYAGRSVVPAEYFDETFDPTAYSYRQIS